MARKKKEAINRKSILNWYWCIFMSYREIDYYVK